MAELYFHQNKYSLNLRVLLPDNLKVIGYLLKVISVLVSSKNFSVSLWDGVPTPDIRFQVCSLVMALLSKFTSHYFAFCTRSPNQPSDSVLQRLSTNSMFWLIPIPVPGVISPFPEGKILSSFRSQMKFLAIHKNILYSSN